MIFSNSQGFKKRSLLFCYSFLIVFALITVESSQAKDKQNTFNAFFTDNFTYEDMFAPCSGNCSGLLFAGKFLDTSMSNAYGVDSLIPPWEYNFGDSGLIGMAFTKRFLTGFNAFSLETEFGVAQRFGPGAEATEVWGAFYARWHNFPWNDKLYTTVAVSTGLSLASVIDEVEKVRSINNSKLLHYLSPEVTFASPDRKDRSLVIRLHHRSGGKMYGMDSGIFGGTSGGAQYLTIGIRQNF